MSSLIRDLGRLVNGVALVVKEIARHSDVVETARKRNVPSFILSATDLAGLTRGKVHEYSKPKPSEGSVVYFPDDRNDLTGQVAAAPLGATGPVEDVAKL
ncbi:hypothetical protein Nepgr_025537 [Nepenthes gracilis]|uniref:Uncharacterized protein n=1 Tax=Nepenthes gracilis TaxID=150966 RepID=A0AAD3T6J9_NEPGR|nr:hypothetical protein Nepgr_025537 [Nepenthes gracilis]